MNDTRQHIARGAEQARRLYVSLRNRMDRDDAVARLREEATQMAARLNMEGTSLSAFLEETAALQGFAAQVRDLQYVPESVVTEDELDAVRF